MLIKLFIPNIYTRTLLKNKEEVAPRWQFCEPVRFTTQFWAQWQFVHGTPNKQWHVLKQCLALKDIIDNGLKMVARRIRNLGYVLVKSEFIQTLKSTWLSHYPWTQGIFPCGRCQICPFVEHIEVITDAEGLKTFSIRRLMNCANTRVIYEMNCPCGKMYVGKTKPLLRLCISEHLSNIKKKEPGSPLAQHFVSAHDGKLDGLKVKGRYTLRCPFKKKAQILRGAGLC